MEYELKVIRTEKYLIKTKLIHVEKEVDRVTSTLHVIWWYARDRHTQTIVYLVTPDSLDFT